jgi:hypothetical protein
MRYLGGTAERPCSCVFRAIFRACYRRFREFTSQSVDAGLVSLEHIGGPVGKRMYSLKREEFLADFNLIARRSLSENDYRLFRFTFLLGADWALCCKRLNMDRGNYFHAVYRVEAILGREFAELKPYPLYPLDEYFGGVIEKRSMSELRAQLSDPRIKLRRSERLPMTA